MRKWLAAGILVLLFPWAVSLVWMGVTGAGAPVSGNLETGAGLPVSENARAGADIGSVGGEAWVGADIEAAGEGTRAGADTGAVGEDGHAGAEVRTAGAESVSAGKRILVVRDGIQTYMDLEDYLPGVVLCQLAPELAAAAPADLAPELLKCQTVIARTYISRLMEGRTEIREEELDLDYPGILDKQVLDRREHALELLERCKDAVRETNGSVMQWNGRAILPLFHWMSAGRTRKGAEDFPYLQSVESPWDTRSETYLTSMEWSRREFARALRQLPDLQTLTDTQLCDQIQVVEKDDSGYVLQLQIGTKTCSGEEVQAALQLPSACYTLEADETNVRALVRGSGHGYGLSQNGALGMAAEGWGWEEILYHYYKDVTIQDGNLLE